MNDSNNRRKAIVVGIAIGALMGAVFAWMATDIDDDDEEGGLARLGASDYFSLGMSVLTLARQFGDMLR